MEKGGGVEGAPGNRDKNFSGIHQEEVGDGSGVGGPATKIRGLCEIYSVQGRGEGSRAVVASDSRRTAADGHAKIDIGSSVGAAANGEGEGGA